MQVLEVRFALHGCDIYHLFRATAIAAAHMSLLTFALCSLRIRRSLLALFSHSPRSTRRRSCPTESCRGKKVVPSDGGTFFCEKCQSATDRPQPRFLLSLTIQDQTGSAWVSAFDREAEVRRAATARHRGCCGETDDAPQNKTAMH